MKLYLEIILINRVRIISRIENWKCEKSEK